MGPSVSVKNPSHTDAARGLWRADFTPPGCPGVGKNRRLQDVLDPVYKAKVQLLLQIFLLRSVGEEDSRRKG